MELLSTTLHWNRTIIFLLTKTGFSKKISWNWSSKSLDKWIYKRGFNLYSNYFSLNLNSSILLILI
jgi:hypothetical protein